MFSQYFKLNSLVLILVLILAPFFPLQVRAEETPETIPEEIPADLPAEAPIEEQTTSEDTTIETGDAVAETEILNEVNVNTVETQPSPEATVGEAETVPAEEVIENEESTPLSLDVSVENEGVIESESETTAETGENSAIATENATIETGDAYSSANVVSVVNLNLIESNGFLLLLNNFLSFLGHIDLRPLAPSTDTATLSYPCDLSDCGALTSLKVEAENKAGISNVVIVRSRTGVNSAEGNNALINTGNAYAGANVVNVANTNIIDSNYLLLAFNNFGNWNGDLIFPNFDFFSSFFSPFGSASGMKISTDNSANLENNLEVLADTGENEATGDESSIATGEAIAGSNVTNIVKTYFF